MPKYRPTWVDTASQNQHLGRLAAIEKENPGLLSRSESRELAGARDHYHTQDLIDAKNDGDSDASETLMQKKGFWFWLTH